MRNLTLRLLGSATVLAALAIPSWVQATHSWGGYHWGRTANPFTLTVDGNLTGIWATELVTDSLGNSVTHLNLTASDWSKSTVLDLSPMPGTLSNLRRCSPVAGRVEVCNYRYGFNGWLGVAQIWASGTHITQGTVKLNDTYFCTPTYNSAAWRQMVICQEVGHTLGLDHQDENFSNPNLGTCMDYTNAPTSNQHPNDHDFEELALIYGHTDALGTILSTPPSAAAGNAPAEWGRLVHSGNRGLTQVFEQELGGGHRLITFVIWVDGAHRGD